MIEDNAVREDLSKVLEAIASDCTKKKKKKKKKNAKMRDGMGKIKDEILR